MPKGRLLTKTKPKFKEEVSRTLKPKEAEIEKNTEPLQEENEINVEVEAEAEAEAEVEVEINILLYPIQEKERFGVNVILKVKDKLNPKIRSKL